MKYVLLLTILLSLSFAMPEQLDDPEIDPMPNITILYHHFYKSAFNLDLNISTCVPELNHGAMKILLAIQGMAQEKNPVAWVVFGMVLREGVNTLAVRTSICQEAWPVFKQGVDMVHPLLENYSSLAATVTQAVASNPSQFLVDAYSIYTSLNPNGSVDFKAIGKATGDAVRMMLEKA
ncbi:unnamed protein product [Moneuplotes crassus]|uniref:Uncharacterized protein n=1 Tax=Euplotes crassus TaxID=5936 RepID=A0AAD1Y150_EUPCR|nr:unnamed protein product [Moneuplotes crassus]